MRRQVLTMVSHEDAAVKLGRAANDLPVPKGWRKIMGLGGGLRYASPRTAEPKTTPTLAWALGQILGAVRNIGLLCLVVPGKPEP